jgi:hypothetical protein
VPAARENDFAIHDFGVDWLLLKLCKPSGTGFIGKMMNIKIIF